MNTNTLLILGTVEKLEENAKIAVLEFAKSLLEAPESNYSVEDEEDYWVAEYDKAMAEDDGYRISTKELRVKYGL